MGRQGNIRGMEPLQLAPLLNSSFGDTQKA
jgi:hypothetical protein